MHTIHVNTACVLCFRVVFGMQICFSHISRWKRKNLRISSLHAYYLIHMPTCLSTSVHYKPTDSHNYLLHSSSHPQHVENAIPFSQFLRLRRLCIDDTDFNNYCEEMCQFFKKTRLPWLRRNHRQTPRPRNRPRDRTTNFTERRNRQNSIHPYLPSTKPCNQNVILKIFSAMIPKLNTYFLYHHSSHSNATKTWQFLS